ncbi:MAG: SCO family protein [Acidobacteria bacterium]|nr:SCO family protein [Acidobacteriota bacterium]
MRRSKAFSFVMTVMTAISIAAPLTLAQKNEHYNSPLYSPRVYDPNVDSTTGLPGPLKEIGIEQKLNEQLPLDVEMKDEDGRIVRLGDYFNKGRPVLIAFVYYECPMLCSQVLNGLTGSLKGMSFDAGKEFDVVAISFDAGEFDKPELAKAKKAAYMERYGRPGTEAGWHFLTGSEESIKAVTSAAGFSFKWDERSQQFAHAAAIIVATPEGKLSRYLFGIDYSPKDLKFGIMESAENKVGNIAEKLMLYCYHYDPSTGKYGLAVMNVMRLGGIATLLGLGAMLFVFWRRGKKKEGDANLA